MAKRLCLILAGLLCMISLTAGAIDYPDRIGALGIVEQVSDQGDSFWVREPYDGGVAQEVHVTEATVLDMEEPVQDGLIVYVRFESPISSDEVGQIPVDASHIQHAYYDVTIDSNETNPVDASGTLTGYLQVQLPASTDLTALGNELIRFVPYVVEGSDPTKLVEAREFEVVNIIGGDIVSIDGDSIEVKPDNAEWESIRVLITDDTILLHELNQGDVINIVCSELDDSVSPPQVTALTIWISIG